MRLNAEISQPTVMPQGSPLGPTDRDRCSNPRYTKQRPSYGDYTHCVVSKTRAQPTMPASLVACGVLVGLYAASSMLTIAKATMILSMAITLAIICQTPVTRSVFLLLRRQCWQGNAMLPRHVGSPSQVSISRPSQCNLAATDGTKAAASQPRGPRHLVQSLIQSAFRRGEKE